MEYEQRHVYAGSERLEQITEKGNGSWERTLYVHEDVMGNTRYYTKTTGQTFAELQYDAWGQPVSPNKLVNNDHGNYVFATFTGHIYDTTLDIYFAEARFYDATNRTWMAMDPIKDGLNWYQYAFSNPTTYWDPTGMFAAELTAVAAVNPYALAALIIAGGTFALLPQETKDQINAGISNALRNATQAVDSYFSNYYNCDSEQEEDDSSTDQEDDEWDELYGDYDEPRSNKAGRQNGNTPRDNQKQNKQTDDISRKLRLTPDQQRELHDEIGHKGYGYQEILDIARGMFGK